MHQHAIDTRMVQIVEMHSILIMIKIHIVYEACNSGCAI